MDISASAKQDWFSKEPMHCPKCDYRYDPNNGKTIGVSAVTVQLGTALDGKYCLHCWAAWMASNVPKLEPTPVAK